MNPHALQIAQVELIKVQLVVVQVVLTVNRLVPHAVDQELFLVKVVQLIV